MFQGKHSCDNLAAVALIHCISGRCPDSKPLGSYQENFINERIGQLVNVSDRELPVRIYTLEQIYRPGSAERMIHSTEKESYIYIVEHVYGLTMTVNNLFTYENLYAGKPHSYHLRPVSQPLSSFISNDLLPTTTPIIPTTHLAKLISPTDIIELRTETHKLVDVIPFTIFYWLLVVLAVLLAMTLVTVFTCYCRSFVKNYGTRRESLLSFNRYRPSNRRTHTPEMYQSTTIAPPPPPAPESAPLSLFTPPCPSQSLKYIDNQLYRQDLETTSPPPLVRHDLYLKEPLSTFASSTSNLHSGLQSRLSTLSSDPLLNFDQLYESQRASMVLNDELQNESLIIDIN